MGIVILDNLFFNKILYNFNTSLIEIIVIFDECLKRFEYILWFIDGIILNKIFIFFDYFCYKWFYWL